jgi:hypothetical protein
MPTAASAKDGSVEVRWNLQSSWPDGYVAQLVLTAPTSVASGWSVSWPDPHARAIANSWGMRCSLDSGVVRCAGADWATQIPARGPLTVGLQVANDGTAPTAPILTVN